MKEGVKMANKTSNYPSNQLNNLEKGVSSITVRCLKELSAKGKPTNTTELKKRIDSYFEFCANEDFRPGIESLCLSLGVTRTTLWNWCKQKGCDEEWAEECQKAKQFILTFLEQISLTGKINPASSIFYLKNWGAYSDNYLLENTIPSETTKEVITIKEMQALENIKNKIKLDEK
jgi:hypothetical protein